MISYQKLPDAIFQHWVHSHEEDESEIKFFRNADYEFPMSRLRMGFDLKKDGTFIQYTIGSNDLSKKVFGNWELVDNKIKIFLRGNETIKFIEILSCDENLLKIKETNQ